MPKSSTPSTDVRGLSDIKDKIGRVPIIRRSSFVYGSLAGLIGYALFLLPAGGALGAVDLGRMILFVLLLLMWAAIIFTDELKSEKFKTAAVFSIFIISAWLFYRYSDARWGEIGYLFFNVEMIQKAWPTLMEGFWTTLFLAVCAAIMSTILGLLLAVFRTFNNAVLNVFIIGYIDFFRAMPIIVLMMLMYYALPFMGIRLSAIMSGILALGLNSSAYVSEIFRAGFSFHQEGADRGRPCPWTQRVANHAFGDSAAGLPGGYSPLGRKLCCQRQGHGPGLLDLHHRTSQSRSFTKITASESFALDFRNGSLPGHVCAADPVFRIPGKTYESESASGSVVGEVNSKRPISTS